MHKIINTFEKGERKHQIIGTNIVTTTTENSVLSVQNPAGNAAALTVTPVAGGTNSVAANLTIIRLN